MSYTFKDASASTQTAASEAISSVNYPQVKLIDSTSSSTTPTGVAANPLQVSLANTAANSTAVKVDGSAITQPVSISSLPALATGSNTIGNVGASAATGSTVPANAFYKGTLAKTALPTAVSDGQLVGAMADKFGRQVILPTTTRDLIGSQTTTITSSTSETTIVTAAASTYNDLLALFISNTSATAARVDVRDTTAGSVIFQFYIPAGDVRGVSLTTAWPQTSVNTNWTAQSSASVSDLRISALFAKNK